MTEVLSRKEGSVVFGVNVEGYRKGRPDYPPRIYQLIKEYTRGQDINDVFEVGPGTGQATEQLLNSGLTVTAIEPDKHFSENLQSGLLKKHQDKLRVLNGTFEDMRLLPGSFDLGVAATSWHWVEPLSGSAKAFDVLRPGGCFAIWWTIFENESYRDEFQKKTAHLFNQLPYTPSYKGVNVLPYGMQKEARLKELTNAGFTDIYFENIDWEIEMSAEQTKELISTFSPVIKLDELIRLQLLKEINKIVNEVFEGKVIRNFKSVIYLCRKPNTANNE